MRARTVPFMLGPALLAGLAAAETVNGPQHAHTNNASTTNPWISVTHDANDAHVAGIHQHQHRTPHPPSRGLHVHGGVEPYNTSRAGWVWIERELVARTLGAAPQPPVPIPAGAGHATLGDQYAHGHQHHLKGRYVVEPATAGGQISVQEAKDWNDHMERLVDNALNAGIPAPQPADPNHRSDGWARVGRRQEDNWPNTDDTSQDPPENAVAIHSAIQWERVSSTSPHELRILYGDAADASGAIRAGVTAARPGHHAAGAGAMVIVIDHRVAWFWGVDADPTVSPNLRDLQTAILHELGHAMGLGHFGNYEAGYLMADVSAAGQRGRPHRGGAGGIQHSIDADAEHGLLDLYSTPAHRRGPVRVSRLDVPDGGSWVHPADQHLAFAQGPAEAPILISQARIDTRRSPGSGQAAETFAFDAGLEARITLPEVAGSPLPLALRGRVELTVREGFLALGRMRLAGDLMLPSGAELALVLRDTPDRATTGLFSARRVGDVFEQQGFFDLASELSVDGGETFVPARWGTTVFELQPDEEDPPDPRIGLALVALLGLALWFAIRRQRSAAA